MRKLRWEIGSDWYRVTQQISVKPRMLSSWRRLPGGTGGVTTAQPRGLSERPAGAPAPALPTVLYRASSSSPRPAHQPQRPGAHLPWLLARAPLTTWAGLEGLRGRARQREARGVSSPSQSKALLQEWVIEDWSLIRRPGLVLMSNDEDARLQVYVLSPECGVVALCLHVGAHSAKPGCRGSRPSSQHPQPSPGPCPASSSVSSPSPTQDPGQKREVFLAAFLPPHVSSCFRLKLCEFQT